MRIVRAKLSKQKARITVLGHMGGVRSLVVRSTGNAKKSKSQL